MEQLLSEKTLAEGNLTVVRLTSDNAFAAKNLPVYGRKVILR